MTGDGALHGQGPRIDSGRPLYAAGALVAAKRRLRCVELAAAAAEAPPAVDQACAHAARAKGYPRQPAAGCRPCLRPLQPPRQRPGRVHLVKHRPSRKTAARRARVHPGAIGCGKNTCTYADLPASGAAAAAGCQRPAPPQSPQRHARQNCRSPRGGQGRTRAIASTAQATIVAAPGRFECLGNIFLGI